MALHLEILDRTPAEGARIVALALLSETREQAARLEDPSDVEALHDFRVSVRRLRSVLRSWREPLGEGVRGKDLRRLRRVARTTSASRDAEVLLAWVDGIADALPPAHRVAADWLSARLAPRIERAGLASSLERFRAASTSLTRRLGRERPLPSDETFGMALAGRIREQVASVKGCLSRVETASDAALAHRARIEGKRLRYLLEPLRDVPGADSGPAVKELKRLQDLLGDLNDAHVATAALREARHAAEVERVRTGDGGGIGLRPGLLALELRARERADALFERLRDEVLATGGEELLAPSLEVAAALEARAVRGEPAGGEARHLLLALPDGAVGWPGVDEEAGWLPGSGGREGFRVLRDGSGERHLREIAIGSGAGRSVAVDPVDTATFEAYWPLTEGRRFHRLRRVDPSGSGWRVDEFLDRALVLAVGPAGTEPPAWVEPVLIRDVGAERAYRDDAIARRARRP